MPAMITEVEDFFAKGCGRCDRFATTDCSTRRWIAGLLALRAIAKDMGLSEHAKWGHPCYMHAGRNIVLLGAFRGDFRLTFFNAALLTDPSGLLVRQGPNTRHPDAVHLSDVAEIAAKEAAIRALLAQAMALAEAGALPPRDVSDPDLPEELTEALDADPALAEAFHALTRGRQKSYVIALASAKTAATRVARVEKLRARIFAGKGATEM